MKLTNAKLFLDGKFREGSIEFDRIIRKIDIDSRTDPGEAVDLNGAYVIPGLIDIHTHAAMGADASDGDPEGLKLMSRYYAAQGVTSWLPTTMTLKEPQLTSAMQAIRAFVRPRGGAKIAGVHAEGPFLSYAKRGAQNAENLHAPDIAMFRRLMEASGDQIRLITVAPEEPGAIDFIREASRLCTVSLGHTTADYDTAMAAYAAGASHATHLFNGMPALQHRAPGVIAAAFDAGASVEMIPDGFHIHPSVIRLTQKLFGDKFCLISDSLRCAGMPDGDYELGGQDITLKNGKATLRGSDTLAGSSIHLMEGLRRTVSFGIPLEEAVFAATEAPARAIRMENTLGRLKTGRAADLVVLNPELEVLDVFIDGQSVIKA